MCTIGWSWDSAKHEEKLIRLREANDKLAHQICAKSYQVFSANAQKYDESILLLKLLRLWTYWVW